MVKAFTCASIVAQVRAAALSLLVGLPHVASAQNGMPSIILASSTDRATAERDVHGIALGGVRTPWTEVPTIRLSGISESKSFLGVISGSGVPFTKAELGALYPGGKAEYLHRFTASLDAAIEAGHLSSDDRQEILEIAAINFDAAPYTKVQ
ncbi:MAG: alpha/beta hydrolase domain-containing protein [Novosphingobium sp.]